MYHPNAFRLPPTESVEKPKLIRVEDVNALLPSHKWYTIARWSKIHASAKVTLYVNLHNEWRDRRESEREHWDRLIDSSWKATAMPTVHEV